MQEFLIYIKEEIKRKITLNQDKEKLIDQKIIFPLSKETELTSDEIKCHYIKLYTALYFNNIDILKLLTANNISLGTHPSNLSIYLLDSNFTKYFTNSSYVNFINRYKRYLHSFFLSIKDLNYAEKEIYIKRFIHLVTILEHNLETIESYHPFLGSSLFNKKALDTFTNETYLLASPDQLNNIIAPLEKTPSKPTIKRLNKLISSTNFSLFFHNYDLMFELFSDEELIDMSTSPEYFFTKVLNNQLDITRALYIYKHYPEIIDNCGCLTPETFNNYSDDEIISLSKSLNFNSPSASKKLKFYNLKRRVLSLLPGTK